MPVQPVITDTKALARMRDTLLDGRDNIIGRLLRGETVSEATLRKIQGLLDDFRVGGKYMEALRSIMTESAERTFVETCQTMRDYLGSRSLGVLIPEQQLGSLFAAKAYTAEAVTTVFTDKAIERIGNAVRSAYLGSSSTGDAVQRIAREFDGRYWKAQSVLLTELGNVGNNGAREETRRVNALGKDIGIEYRSIWEHSMIAVADKMTSLTEAFGPPASGSKRYTPRDHHLAMHGIMANEENLFEFVDATGTIFLIEGPYDAQLDAGEIVNCGCMTSVELVDVASGKVIDEQFMKDELSSEL